MTARSDKEALRRTIRRLKERRVAVDTLGYYFNAPERLEMSIRGLGLKDYDDLLRLAEIGLELGQ